MLASRQGLERSRRPTRRRTRIRGRSPGSAGEPMAGHVRAGRIPSRADVPGRRFSSRSYVLPVNHGTEGKEHAGTSAAEQWRSTSAATCRQPGRFDEVRDRPDTSQHSLPHLLVVDHLDLVFQRPPRVHQHSLQHLAAGAGSLQPDRKGVRYHGELECRNVTSRSVRPTARAAVARGASRLRRRGAATSAICFPKSISAESSSSGP